MSRLARHGDVEKRWAIATGTCGASARGPFARNLVAQGEAPFPRLPIALRASPRPVPASRARGHAWRAQHVVAAACAG